jgi:hypothetical protein
MNRTPDDRRLEARREIAEAIVTAAERGHELTVEDLEAQGQPIAVLGPDRETQAEVVAAWTRRATQRVAEVRAALAAVDRDANDDSER